MEYRVIRTDSEDELYHYGVKGMKWGHRKRQAFSAKATGHRALAKVYDLNARTYKKSNKALSSMNAAAKTTQLKKAEQAQEAANQKREQRLERKTYNKTILREANQMSYKKSIGKTLRRSGGIILGSAVAAAVADSAGKESVANTITNIGSLALKANTIAGCADVGRVYAKRNGWI